jgi:tRNA threonylcarbamoyladenosine biosynthesis protein TsaE
MPYVSRKVRKVPPKRVALFVLYFTKPYTLIYLRHTLLCMALLRSSLTSLICYHRPMKEPFMVTEADLTGIAKNVIDTLSSSYSPHARVLFLEGDLGTGKTTFTKALAEELGVNKDDVHSPTFILKKEYQSAHTFFKKLIHIDAYRFESKEEVEVLKLSRDRENPHTLIVIEWPSKMAGTVNEDMTISFTVVDDDTREVMISYTNSSVEKQTTPQEETPHISHLESYFRT